MGLYLLDYGAGNVQSLANTLTKLGHSFKWIKDPADFSNATSLIFPGVGAFETAITNLHSKGLFEPLKKYIQSGKPYFGICVGLQVLFESSTEAPPSCHGLGIVPCAIERFFDNDKSVPHMGWNAADLLDTSQDSEGVNSSSYYYFVHSYGAKYSPTTQPDAMRWAHTTTQYGKEIFVSSIRRGNVFATQFHPEKSGAAGFALIDEWLKKPLSAHINAPDAPLINRMPLPVHKLTKRIVACMDVRANDEGDLVVTKGDQYDVREKIDSSSSTSVKAAGAVRNLGKPIALAQKYYASGADELCLLNITSFRHSPLQDQPMLAIVSAAAQEIFVPLTIGGGIKDTVDPDGTPRSALEVASAYFRKGADKVSIGSEAVYAVEKLLASGGKKDGTSAIETIAHAYGKQAVVVSIDPRRVYVDNPASYDGPYKDELIIGSSSQYALAADKGKSWWYQCTVSGGRETRPLSVVQLAKGVETLGAGEILVNSIDRDGTGFGFDLDLVKLIKKAVKIPVVASSGAGSTQHFVDVFRGTDVEAALAAGIFHREEVGIDDVKMKMKEAGVNARVVDPVI
ncbi:imidazoleglycerol phosphate synthase [Crepidotus variabilis]|uniref:Imidazole glycerol phosphate synthase hisHF n=1 Tax=Crepidotus variabilis TaxID=179855 RepID=A0A9P6ESM7_9AGAR|nr:imidazoleglycerol phosphate synthase [Crepidotus variabilis]